MTILYDQVKALFEFADNPVKRVGMGFKQIDNLIGGPAPGEVCMIIARSGTGKSIVGQNIILNNKNLPSIFFSMEMPYMQAVLRLYSMWSDTAAIQNQHQLEGGHIDPEMWDMVLAFPAHIIDDASQQTLEMLTTRLERFEMEYNIRPEFVVVDYLELLGGAKASGEGFTAVESQATMLKDWAKEEEMRVFLLHQTNRQEPKWMPPTENSPRFGGFTEADFVIGLWRPHYNPKLPYYDAVNIKHHINFNILKNRAFFEEKSLIEMRFTPSLRIVDG